MFMRPVRMAHVLLLVVFFAGLGYFLSESRRAYPADSPARLKELLKERLAAARDLQKGVTEKLNVGTALIAEVNEARVTLLRAELDLCESDRERIAALENSVAEAKKNEEIVDRQIREGLLAPVELPRVRVSRLETEIELERLKGK